MKCNSELLDRFHANALSRREEGYFKGLSSAERDAAFRQEIPRRHARICRRLAETPMPSETGRVLRLLADGFLEEFRCGRLRFLDLLDRTLWAIERQIPESDDPLDDLFEDTGDLLDELVN